MNATEWAAWIGAVTGMAAFGWNIYLKFSFGPRIVISAWADTIKVPAPPGDSRFLRITVQNTGTASTTLTNVTFHNYQSKRAARKQVAEWNAVVDTYNGPPLPHVLSVGGEWSATMQQDAKLDEVLNAAGPLWCAIHHSFSSKPTQTKVIRL